ncbi:MAG: nitroreductase family deazaflavin-dependent oxidoreductase [Chloroflexota bacterium]|nr:MAG: nitroreductase family deazaflavin-dependent oxidoreductase [Chloroflexota bacterium]
MCARPRSRARRVRDRGRGCWSVTQRVSDASPSAKPPRRSRPRGLLRAFFRAPVVFYRLGLAPWLGRRYLLLTTRGRRSGRSRTCALAYVERGRDIAVLAGWGERSDWYRNAIAEPRVMVQRGTRRWRAHARAVSNGDELREILASLRDQADLGGPPRAIRPFLRLIGFRYEEELQRAFDHPESTPALVLSPD